MEDYKGTLARCAAILVLKNMMIHILCVRNRVSLLPVPHSLTVFDRHDGVSIETGCWLITRIYPHCFGDLLLFSYLFAGRTVAFAWIERKVRPARSCTWVCSFAVVSWCRDMVVPCLLLWAVCLCGSRSNRKRFGPFPKHGSQFNWKWALFLHRRRCLDAFGCARVGPNRRKCLCDSTTTSLFLLLHHPETAVPSYCMDWECCCDHDNCWEYHSTNITLIKEWRGVVRLFWRFWCTAATKNRRCANNLLSSKMLLASERN